MARSSWQPQLLRVWEVLNRDIDLGTMEYLHSSLVPKELIAPEIRNIVFGFDTNAILRLGLGNVGDNTLDYLRLQHRSAIIVPGQTLQEVWNNQLAGIM